VITVELTAVAIAELAVQNTLALPELPEKAWVTCIEKVAVKTFPVLNGCKPLVASS
jgi:hypothetical protein